MQKLKKSRIWIPLKNFRSIPDIDHPVVFDFPDTDLFSYVLYNTNLNLEFLYQNLCTKKRYSDDDFWTLTPEPDRKL